MDTLDTIISDLTTIATDKGYEGPTVDALIYLMANGIYKNNTNSIVATLEASRTRCKLLNSAIQHALDVSYSVPRGNNQIIKIYNLTPLLNTTVHKFDLCCKVNNYYLYYNADYTFDEEIVGQVLSTPIELVVAKNLITSAQVSATGDVGLTFSDVKNATDVVLHRNNTDGTTEVLDYTESSATLFSKLGTDIMINYQLITNVDYGIKMWYYNKGSSESDAGTTDYSMELGSETYYIVSPEYLEDTIDPSIIKSIPNFTVNQEMKAAIDAPETYKALGGTYYTSKSYIPRESSVNNIYLKSVYAENSQYVIRTINDIKQGIENFINSGAYASQILGYRLILDSNAINIYVYPSVPQGFEDELRDYLQYAFYIDYIATDPDAFKVIAAEPDELVAATTQYCIAINYSVSESLMQTAELEAWIKTYVESNISNKSRSDSPGFLFDPYKLIAEIPKQFSWIVYAGLVTSDGQGTTYSTEAVKLDLGTYFPVIYTGEATVENPATILFQWNNVGTSE